MPGAYSPPSGSERRGVGSLRASTARRQRARETPGLAQPDNAWLDETTQPTAVVEQPSGSGNGFDWSDFGIGAAAMLGLVLLSGGLLAAAYSGRKSGARPRVT